MTITVRFIAVFKNIVHHLFTDDDVTLTLPTPTKSLDLHVKRWRQTTSTQSSDDGVGLHGVPRKRQW